MPRTSLLWLFSLLLLPAVSLIGDTQPAQRAQETPAAAAQSSSGGRIALPADLSWMPKAETGALEFLQKHPDADGRNVVVAIFDTGVDPGAAGLQTTPDGRPKVIDLIDGTGSGDVELGDPVKPNDGKLTGRTGATLTIPADWKNPSGEYRLGMKIGYELFPSELVSVVKAEREKEFRRQQQERIAELNRKLDAEKAKHPKPDDAQKKVQADLGDRIKLLKELLKDYADPGPIYDCVVFHDGEHFRAVIDTDADGDLADETPLTNFRAERKFATFPDPINLNFAVNFYDNGQVLSIVADTGAHGTHVAGIVAAYYKDQPEWNGVAPGAQIVSVKIGDTRLDGMENGPGLVRGLRAVLDNNCDLINMSYGEPTSTPNVGRIAELYSQIVNEHGVIFVSSAGNAGPALTTVGAPGGTTSALIGVGAYVSPEMMLSEYSLRQKLPGLPYTWTSRGPTADGDLGVDIFAPGGAIAPVPQWTRQYSQQMNGTSMASPNACGVIALLLSAAKQEQITYTPHSIRKAIQNTAEPIADADVFGAGPGLIQILPAWDYLNQHGAQYAQKLTYDVRVPTLRNGRGIYLREYSQSRRPQTHRVTVAASLKEKTPIAERLGIAFPLRLKATADWVTCGSLLHLTHGGNRFDVGVDPTVLKPGVHYAEVQASALDSDDESAVLFRVPITVIIPEGADSTPAWAALQKTGTFEPGIVQRHFLNVPAGATWAELKMKLVDTDETKFFRVHTMQLSDGQQFETHESGTYYPLVPNVETVHTFAVVPGRMLEVALAQFWSVLGDSQLQYTIQFHGILPDSRTVALATGSGPQPLTVSNSLAPEEMNPTGSLSTWRRVIAPAKNKITALSRDRDELPDSSSTYELELHYTLKQSDKAEVTVRLLALEDLLYDAPVGPFVYDLLDSNGQRLLTNDMFPDPTSLAAGDYQVVVRIQHHDPAMLEKFTTLPLAIDQKLGSPVALKFWSSHAAAAAQSAGSLKGILETDASRTFFVGEPAAAQLPKSLSAGDLLHGTFTLSSDDHAAAEYNVVFQFAKSASSAASASDKSDDSLADQIFDVKISHLKSLDPTSEDFQKLFEELRADKPEDRRPLTVKLEQLDSDEKRKERLDAVVAAAEELIATFSSDEIATRLGKRVPDGDDAAEKAHKQAEEDKQALSDALYRKARAISYRELPDVVAKTPIVDQAVQDQQFQDALQALSTWVDLSDKEYFLLQVRQLRREGKYAAALLELNKNIESDSPFLYFKKRRDLFEQLEWSDWKQWQEHELLIKFPRKSPPYE